MREGHIKSKWAQQATPLRPEPNEAVGACLDTPEHSSSTSLITQHSPVTTRGKAAPAFTLLEVILAVTIAGALLAGAAAIMVSITDAWLQRQDRHFFEDHVDGVTEFVQACFLSAGQEIALQESDSANSTPTNDPLNEAPQISVNVTTPSIRDGGGIRNDSSDTGTTGNSLLRISEAPIGWSRPPGFADFRDPLLRFGLKETPPLLIQTENAPISGIQAFLYFEEDEGISLLWFTPLQEESEDIDDLRRTPISDLVTRIIYIYWDERSEQWEESDEPREGEGDDEFLLPRFLKLIFVYQEETKERLITIPVPSRSALIF